MPTTTDKITRATEAARALLTEAQPGILTLSEVAEHVATRSGLAVTTGTARNYLRKAVEQGHLVELEPSHHFAVSLPGATKAQIGTVWVARDRWDGQRITLALTRDPEAMRPSSYGPGRTTYLLTPECAQQVVDSYAAEDKAKKAAEDKENKERKEAERAEIKRRAPGLLRLTRKLNLLLRGNPRNGGGFGRVSIFFDDTDTRVEQSIEEQEMGMNIHAYKDDKVAVLHSILEAGIAAHIEAQPVVKCAHCGQRILFTPTSDDLFWWHADTTNGSCKDADTRAEPAKES